MAVIQQTEQDRTSLFSRSRRSPLLPLSASDVPSALPSPSSPHVERRGTEGEERRLLPNRSARTPVAIADVAVILTSLSILFTIWMLTPQFVVPSILENTLLANEKIAWYLTRASGTVGYILLTASTVWGLLLSTKVIKELIPAPVSLAMHNYLAWTSIGLSIFHAFVLLFDSYYTYTIANLLIPFTGPYRPGWVGTGTIGFYLMLLTSVSFYCRQWIGQKTWRKLHYLTFGAYLLATLHGWMAGTDSQLLGPLYAGSLVLVGFLTIYRILTAISDAKAKKA